MGLFLGGRWAVVSVALGVVAACGEAPRVAEHEGDAQVAVSGQALTSSDCPAGYNLIQGTAANDTLQGTAGNDCIIGLGGNDTL